MRINNNISAMNTYSRLNSANTAKSGSLAKLSSGLRINRAGDDAAGLAISEKMRGQIGGLKQATRNAQDGISLIQTAEGGLNETHSILNRMRELAVQSSNDTNTDDDRVEIQKEMDELSKEISRISKNTEFNTKGLLDGDFSAKFHIGANSKQSLELAINDMGAEKLGVAGKDAATFKQQVSVAPGTSTRINDGNYTVVDIKDYKGTALASAAVDGNIADVKQVLTDGDGNAIATSANGKTFTQLDTTAVNRDRIIFSGEVKAGEKIEIASTGTTATSNVGVSKDEHKLDGGTYTIKNLANHATLSAKGFGLANAKGDIVAVANHATLTNVTEWQDVNDTSQVLLGHTANAAFSAGDKIEVTGSGIDVSSQTSADAAITSIDEAIGKVSAERSKLGATQNRLDHTINNLTATAENLSEAESRIRDVDMAEEMMSFTKNNILSQAATSMLAQANQMPQSVLQLLQ